METISNKNQWKSSGLGFGIVLILAGIVLLASNFGWIPSAFKGIVFSWQAIIILVGIMHMTKRHQIAWGLLWIIVGFFFLIPKIVKAFPDAFPNIVAANFTSVYWPLLIILAGIVIIISKFLFPGGKWHANWHNTFRGNQSKTYSSSGGFEKNSIFGAGEHIILDPEFQGGEANAIFGGITLDLRRTTLPVGETKLELNAVFGGLTLYIPGDWNVETRMDTVFGGFEDKRRIIEPVDTERKLIIVGACVFGGGEIMS